MKFCARNTKLQIGTILTKSKSRARLYPDMIISAFAINKTDSKRSAISIIFHAHLFCYFELPKCLNDQQPTSQREKESVSGYLFIYWEGGGDGGGAGWYSTNVYTGEVRPRGPTPSLFTYHFRRKRHLFLSPSIDKSNPFPIPTLKLRIPFKLTKPERFLKFFGDI